MVNYPSDLPPHILDDIWLLRAALSHLDIEKTKTSPRGLETKERENFHIVLDYPWESCWMTYPSRKLSLDYVKAELNWYIRADPRDLSITEHASIWAGIVGADGTLNSNYGRAWFREQQLARCYQTLLADPDSRRAAVVIPEVQMFEPGVKDVPCTIYQSFRIRDRHLNASTHMRSQDVIFGLGNDLPAFVMTQGILASALGVEIGSHALTVDSWHVYSNHYDRLSKMTNQWPKPLAVPWPRPSQAEAIQLLSGWDGTDRGGWEPDENFTAPLMAWLAEKSE